MWVTVSRDLTLPHSVGDLPSELDSVNLHTKVEVPSYLHSQDIKYTKNYLQISRFVGVNNVRYIDMINSVFHSILNGQWTTG